MAEWWHTMRCFHSKRYIIVQLDIFVRSHGKLIFFISTCTRSMATKNGNVVTYCQGFLPAYSYVFLSMCPCQVAWQIKNIISPWPQWQWSPNLSGCQTMWQFVNFIHLVLSGLLSLNLRMCRIPRGGSAGKHLSCHQLPAFYYTQQCLLELTLFWNFKNIKNLNWSGEG